MTIESSIKDMAKSARDAAKKLARVSSDQKNAALLSIAEGLNKQAVFIKEENRKDLALAENTGLSRAMIDRLTIKDATISSHNTKQTTYASCSNLFSSATNQTFANQFYCCYIYEKKKHYQKISPNQTVYNKI